eukprot:2183686-Alexandrium_andersonii.AAC.1
MARFGASLPPPRDTAFLWCTSYFCSVTGSPQLSHSPFCASNRAARVAFGTWMRWLKKKASNARSARAG